MTRILTTGAGSRQNLTVEVGECFRERVTPFVRMCSGRRINVDVMVQQELLQHLARGDEEVTVAALTPEFERVFWKGFDAICATNGGCLDVGHNGHLEVALDVLNEAGKFGRAAHAWQFGTGRHRHVGFERHMVL